MTEITHRFVETNGIRMHIAEAGQGPLVLLLHGFPEFWYTWHHQIQALAQAGYHVVAPDQRGYGQTERPAQIECYTRLHLTGDIVGLLDALGEQQATVVGHDCGAVVAWDLALLRPDRVRGVVALSVPYSPRGPVSSLTAFQAVLGDGFYMTYFQQPGRAEAELERDVHLTIRKMLYSLSGDVPESKVLVVPQGKDILDILQDPETLPRWLSEQDIDYYASEFERTGFSGALNWYRMLEKSWELMAAWAGASILPPALYIAGGRDQSLQLPGRQALIPKLRAFVPNLRETFLLPECGHWPQQERPEEVNAVLLQFLRSLPA